MNAHPTAIAFLSMPGGWEWIFLAVLGLLVFGKRLPEVGKSLGKSIVEFKKGLKGVEDDIDHAVEADGRGMLPPPQSANNPAAEPKQSTPASNESKPS